MPSAGDFARGKAMTGTVSASTVAMVDLPGNNCRRSADKSARPTYNRLAIVFGACVSQRRKRWHNQRIPFDHRLGFGDRKNLSNARDALSERLPIHIAVS